MIGMNRIEFFFARHTSTTVPFLEGAVLCLTMATLFAVDMVSCTTCKYIHFLIPSPMLCPFTEKAQVFRIEERFPSPANSPAKTAMAAAQRGAQATHTAPHIKDTQPAYISSTPPPPTAVASPGSAQQQYTTGQAHPQAVMVPTYVQQQSPIPLVMPQVSLIMYNW